MPSAASRRAALTWSGVGGSPAAGSAGWRAADNRRRRAEPDCLTTHMLAKPKKDAPNLIPDSRRRCCEKREERGVTVDLPATEFWGSFSWADLALTKPELEALGREFPDISAG
jgi:hypothetical protein